MNELNLFPTYEEFISENTINEKKEEFGVFIFASNKEVFNSFYFKNEKDAIEDAKNSIITC